MSFVKITDEELVDKGVTGLPDTPNLSTTDMQKKFDELSKDIIIPKFNELSGELDDADIDDKIATDPNAQEIYQITNIRLNKDDALEVSVDSGEHYKATASSGHRIMDGSGTVYTQRSRLQFSNNCTISDDDVNEATVVLVQPGDKGDKGDAATITIGDVESGDSAEVENVGSATDAIFNFTLPKGDDGDSATIQVGTVTSGATASVSNRGTSSQAIFDFVLPKGDQGDPGTGLTLLGVYATYADLIAAHPTGTRGNAYYVGDDEEGVVYLWDPDTTAWVNVGELKGPKGDTGNAGTISVGTVTEGNSMAVENVGTSTAAVFNFTLKKGDKGDTGNTGTIAVGTVTSGDYPSVTNSGTSTAAVFDFVVPKGDKGDQGNPTTVNGKSGNNVTLYGTDINVDNSVGASTVTTAISGKATKVSGATSGHVASLDSNGDLADSGYTASAIGKWSTAVSCSAGATTATFTDATYSNSWHYKPWVDDGTGEPIPFSKMEVNASNQVVVTFVNALANATSVQLQYWT